MLKYFVIAVLPMLFVACSHVDLDELAAVIQTDYQEAIDREYDLYASEADMLNLALFGCTAKDWEEANPTYAAKGLNLRDTAFV